MTSQPACVPFQIDLDDLDENLVDALTELSDSLGVPSPWAVQALLWLWEDRTLNGKPGLQSNRELEAMLERMKAGNLPPERRYLLAELLDCVDPPCVRHRGWCACGQASGV